MNGKQGRIERYGAFFRLMIVVVATWLGGAQAAHATCSLAAGAREDLLLPPAIVNVALDAPVGATLGSVRAIGLRDIPFSCGGAQNLREVRFAAPLRPLPGFDKVFPTSLAGVGMRVTANGGSFAGIDDGPRAAPYALALTPNARHLTGFGLQVDFIKTGPIRGGVLDAGRLLDVVVGNAELIDVAIPAGAIAFVTRQCDTLHAGGMVAAGVGTGGAFSQETLVVSGGCNPNVAVMLQLDQPYRYGRAQIVTHDAPPASNVAHAAAARGGARRNPLNGFAADAAQDSAGAFSGGATDGAQFGIGQMGAAHGGEFRR